MRVRASVSVCMNACMLVLFFLFFNLFSHIFYLVFGIALSFNDDLPTQQQKRGELRI